MLKCKLKVLFIARSSDMQNLVKNLNLAAFQTRSPSDERDAGSLKLRVTYLWDECSFVQLSCPFNL